MRLAAAVSFLLLAPAGAAQHFHHHADPSPAAAPQFRRSPCQKSYTRPPLNPALQKVKWTVTGSEEGRRYFSQGITEYYGFNFEEAARNFRAALEVDPTMAMAAWGIALASGPNINIDMQGACAKQAHDFSRVAAALAQKQPGITTLERGLIRALALRYGDGGLDSVAYAVALRDVWQTAKEDANVTSLYAESMMDLRPWGLFDNALRPALDTHDIIAALQGALKADPLSVGPNHLLIHAVEAGPEPVVAKRSAEVLAGLVPASGHLVHMPSHIHLLLGDYSRAVEDNTRALEVDLGEYANVCGGSFEEYWANPDCPAVYFGHYVGHNHFFRSVAAAFAGRSADALTSARNTNTHVQRFVVNEPGLQRYLTAPVMMLAAHQRWDEVLKEPRPAAGCYAQKPYLQDTGCHILWSVWYWGQGMANASQGRLDDARKNASQMASAVGQIAPPTPTGWGNNTAATVLAVPSEILLARISWAANRRDEAIEHLKLAVTHADAMVYDEPPQWFAPPRESLGGAYLHTRAYALARDTFESALRRHPRSGRALYGLMRAYEGLGDTTRAAEARQKFLTAWRDADYPMTDQKLW
jgi:tetratricopeptide (TPR) repeat protein